MINQSETLTVQLAERATRLNDGFPDSSVGESLNLLAASQWLGYGVPTTLGGTGGTLLDAVNAIANVAEQCLTSGFVFWCQRAFIQYLVASPNTWLQTHILPQMLQAELSGATGLSNAMKHLAGIERLRIQAEWTTDGVVLNGFLPWASNLQPDQFIVAVAAQTDTGKALVVAVPATAAGLDRGEDLQLLGLQASWTSTLQLNNVQLSHQWVISEDAQTFLPRIRPAFLLLQCGLGLGVSRRAIQETRQSLTKAQVLGDRVNKAQSKLIVLEALVHRLSHLSSFDMPAMRDLFHLRISLTRLAVEAVSLELEAKGGDAYLKPSGTARRLREVAFLPVLTPSLVQLETELRRYSQQVRP